MSHGCGFIFDWENGKITLATPKGMTKLRNLANYHNRKIWFVRSGGAKNIFFWVPKIKYYELNRFLSFEL